MKDMILIIDGDAWVRQLLTDFLTPMYGVSTASSGTEGIERYNERHDDWSLVITDYNALLAKGGDIVGHIRAHDAALPVIVTTGGPTDVVGNALRAMGNVAVCAKPFDFAHLRNMIEQFLGIEARQKPKRFF